MTGQKIWHGVSAEDRDEGEHRITWKSEKTKVHVRLDLRDSAEAEENPNQISEI